MSPRPSARFGLHRRPPRRGDFAVDEQDKPELPIIPTLGDNQLVALSTCANIRHMLEKHLAIGYQVAAAATGADGLKWSEI